MKLLSSQFVAPVVLVALSALAGCSSDTSGTAGTAGSSPGGASGKAGSGAAGVSGAGVSGGGVGGSTAGAAGGLSSAGAAGGTAAAAMTFTTLKGLIATSCFGNGCHSQEGNPLQMNINDGSLYTKLTTHLTVNCGKLVNVPSPATSALVKLLQGDCGTPPNVTSRMPFGICFDGDTDPESPCIQPDKIAAIQAWIASGAPNN